MKTLVLGLGNPILGDDGVGWRVAEIVARQIRDASVEVDYHAGGGLSLMERLVGYDRAILIDAVTAGGPVGTVSRLRLDDLPDFSSVHTTSAHDASLQTALKLGQSMGAHLPETVMVVGVEAERLYDFDEQLTPTVAAAVPAAVEAVLDLL